MTYQPLLHIRGDRTGSAGKSRVARCLLALLAMSTACVKEPQTDPSLEAMQDRVEVLERQLVETQRTLAELKRLNASLEDTSDKVPDHTPAASATSVNDEPRFQPEPRVYSEDLPTDAETAPSSSGTHASDSSTIESSNEIDRAPLVEMGIFDIDAKYQEAYKHYEARRFNEAKAIYQNIAKNHADHKLAPNALYWLGEIEYDRGNYNQAILAFQKVLERHPKSHKVPDALLKLGKARERLGQLDEAREDYRRVIERYPDSKAAKIAKTWL
ncbi:tol-pal system protein YbgF [Sulfidibacter corallicola]|uniref:Tol-pal system protein YbgF n=1 Tax=Sulfidibacter corallicola TaxID=2818388 RepID=A0A8A4TMM1_SULCO|nr:tol-pal system protein YbgF [Sulfidibacter corallicola]QTD50800.1 tol-pal system protein YbgF [Sulfidibacter corallicola]